MVDIHSHILWGLDDGAKTFEDSLAMVRMAAENGTTDIVATPHSNLEYRFQPETISERIEELQAACGPAPRIHRGCDFHLSFENIQNSLDNPAKFAINHKHYVLVEFADSQISKMTDEIFARMQAAGMTPIITHPERNPLLRQNTTQLNTWIQVGCLLQVTAGSLMGRFGKTAKASADDLLRRKMVHFVASDAHDTKHRTPVLKDAHAYVAAEHGKDMAATLFYHNPKATLTGDWVDVIGNSPGIRRKWFQFWKTV